MLKNISKLSLMALLLTVGMVNATVPQKTIHLGLSAYHDLAMEKLEKRFNICDSLSTEEENAATEQEAREYAPSTRIKARYYALKKIGASDDISLEDMLIGEENLKLKGLKKLKKSWLSLLTDNRVITFINNHRKSTVAAIVLTAAAYVGYQVNKNKNINDNDDSTVFATATI